MSFLDQVRAAIPELSKLDDDRLVDAIAEKTGKPRDVVAEEYEVFDPRKKRNVGAVANDAAIEMANAAAGAVKSGIDFVQPGTEISRGIQRFIEHGEQSQSYAAQRSKRQLAEALNTDQVGTQLGGVWDYATGSPILAASQAAGSFALPGAAIKGGHALGAVAGLGKRGIERAGLGAGMGASGMLSGGDAAGNAYELVMNSPQLAHLSEEERHTMAVDAARKASVAPALYGAATGAFGAEGALARGASKGILKTGLKEAGLEAGDEGLSQFSGRYSASQYDDTINPMTGVVGSAALGGVLGGMTGAAVGAMTRPQVNPDDLADKGKETSLLVPNPPTGGDSTPYEIEQAFAAQQLGLFTPDQAPMPFQGPLMPQGPQGDLFTEAGIRPPDRSATQALAPAAPAVKPAPAAKPTPVEDVRAPMIGTVRGAYEKALTDTGVKSNPGQVARAVSRMTSGLNSVEEVTEKLDMDIASLMATKKKDNLARAETLAAVRDNLRGVPEAQRTSPVSAAPQQASLPTVEPPSVAATQQPTPVAEEPQSPLDSLARELIATVSKAQGENGPRNAEMMLKHLVDEVPLSQLAKEYGLREDSLKEIKSTYVARMAALAKSRGLTPEQIQGMKKSTESDREHERRVIDGKRRVVQEDAVAEEVAEGIEPTAKPVGGAALGADAIAGNRDALETADVFQSEGMSIRGPNSGATELEDAAENQRIERVLKKHKGDLTKLKSHQLNVLAEKRLREHAVQPTPERYKEIQAIVAELQSEARQAKIRAERNAPDLTDGVTDQEENADGIEEIHGQEGRGDGEQVAVPAEETGKQSTPAQGQVPAKKRLLKKKAEPAPAPVVETRTAEERAGEAWDKHKGKDVPPWASLTDAQRETFVDFGPENWTAEDVALEAKKLQGAADAKLESALKDIAKLTDTVEELKKVARAGATPMASPNARDMGNASGRATPSAAPRLDKIAEPEKAEPKVNRVVEDEDDTSLEKAMRDQSALAWNRMFQGVQSIPVFSDLPQELQDQWTALGPKNWNRGSAIKIIQSIDGAEAVQRSEQREMFAVDRLLRAYTQAQETVKDSGSDRLKQLVAAYKSVVGAMRDSAKRVPVSAERDKLAGDMARALERELSKERTQSERNPPVGGSRVEDIRAELKEFMGYLNPSKVQVVQNPDEIPRHVLEADERAHGPMNPSVQGFVHNGKAWLIASHIQPGTAKAVFLHEVGSHLGLEGALTDEEFDLVIDQINEWAGNNNGSLEHQIAVAALERVWGAQTTGGKANTELVAYFIEEALNAGVNPTLDLKTDLGRWMSRVWLIFKKALSKFGWHVKNKPTANDLVDMAYAAARMEMVSRARPAGAGRSFIGVKSDTAKEINNLTNFTAAKLMDSQGQNPEKIWEETGWFKGPDGEWRMEIPDTKASLKPEGILKLRQQREVRMRELLDHPALYRAYPDAGGILVYSPAKQDSDIAAHTAAGIVMGSSLMERPGRHVESGLSILLHEVQHWIQDREDFARGSNSYDRNNLTERNLDNLLRGLDDFSMSNFWAPEMYNSKESLRRLVETLRPRVREVDAAIKKYNDADAVYEQWNDSDKLPWGQIYDKYLKPAADTMKEAKQEAATAMQDVEYILTKNNHGPLLREGLYYMSAGEIESYTTQRRLQALDNDSYPPRGSGVPFDRQIVTKRSERSERIQSALPKPAQSMLKSVTTTLKDAGKKGALVGAITQDIIDMASKAMPSAQRYLEAQQARQATRLEHEREIDRVLSMYDHLGHEERGTGPNSVNAYIFDSTMSGKWGYKLDDISDFQPDPELARRFNKFSAEGQKLIRAVFSHGHKTLQLKQAAVRAAINADYDEQVAEADELGKKKLEKDRNVMLSRYASLMSIKSNTPYAPIKRFGNYVTIGMSKAYADAKAGGLTGEMTRLETNLDHYWVSFHETLAEADAKRAEIASRYESTGGSAVASQRESVEEWASGDVFVGFAKLRKMLHEEFGDKASTKEMDSMLRSLYLTSLAEASGRKSELHRRGIAGGDRDMMRALATQGRADAHFLSTVQHEQEVINSLSAMRKEAKAGDRQNNMRYFNELLIRHQQSMNQQTHRAEDFIKRATSIWMLSTSPAFYAQQLSQTYVVTQPVLAGKFGYWKSMKAITKGYLDALPMFKGFDPVDLTKAPTDVRAMLETLTSHGKIDIGIDVELGSWATSSSATTAWNKFDKFLRHAVMTLESFNRSTAAIAAYRMEKSKQLAEGKQEAEAHNAATRYAEKIIHSTHGSYDGFNTPRIMSTAFPGARVITQFRRYQIIQMSLLARLFHGAYKGSTPEEKAVARKGLGYTIGHGLIFTGALGAPVVSSLATVGIWLFGDEDDPEKKLFPTQGDKESFYRKAIGDQDVADLVLNGTPAALGLSVAQKIGWQNMLSLMPFVDADPFTKKGYEQNVVGLLGPAVSLVGKVAQGIGDMRSGEYYKGMEKMLPNGFGNAMRGYRFSSEGVTLKNGDVVLPPEEISFIDGLFQGLGLPPEVIARRNFAQGQKLAFEAYYDEQTTQLKGRYARAYRDGNAEEMMEVRGEWEKLQTSRTNNGFKRQPLSDLLRAPQIQRKRESQTIDGIEYRQNNRDFVRNLMER